MKRRIFRVIRLGAALLAAGCVYAWVCGRLGFGIPCLFRLATGLQCPGCGVSRMCMALLRLDLAGAWQANPAVLGMLPLGLVLGADVLGRYVRTGAVRTRGWSTWALWGMIGVLLVFGIVRNIR